MIVYCDAGDCKHNEDGRCVNKFPIGTEAIKITEDYMGIPCCADFEDAEEDE